MYLLGENGAGKSTLMNILSGAYARDDGRIFLNGDAVEPRDPRHAQALGISIIYQTFSQAPHLTVAENLFLGREPLTRWGSIDIRKTRAMSQKALAPVGLSVDPDTPIKKLSVAQRQMVEIAKALSLNAKVVIMDEPTSALTDFETRRLFGIIRSLRAAGAQSSTSLTNSKKWLRSATVSPCCATGAGLALSTSRKPMSQG